LARVNQHPPALTLQDGWCVDKKHFFRLYSYPLANHNDTN